MKPRFSLRDQGVTAGDMQSDPELAEVVGRLAIAHSGMATGRITPAQIAAAMTGLVGVAGYMGISKLSGGGPPWISMLGGVLVALVYLRIVFFFARRRGTDQLVETILAEGRCPCCLYKLGAVRASDDGRVQCPECGAAWRHDRIGTLRARASPDVATAPRRRPPNPWRLTVPVVADARGRYVRLVDVRRAPLVAKLGEAEGSRLAAAARAVYMRKAIVVSLLIVLVLVPGMTLAMITLPSRLASGIAASLLRVGALGIAALYAWMMLGMSWKWLTGRSQNMAARVARAVVAEGCCAACAAPLSGVEPQDDGCVECPACAAAWKRETPAGARLSEVAARNENGPVA
ncbi:MAG: hypothetical protein AMXMBFR58_20160 [Phycisphaerae bacterium]